jgi:hypothetical protein
MRRSVAGLAFACALLLASRLATADEAAERAEGRRHFEQAEQHFQRGEFAEALVQYEAGYRLTRLPGFIINVAHCHRLMGDLRKARSYYRRYLVVAPVGPRKDEVEEMIATLDKALAEEGAAEGAEGTRASKPRTPSVRWWLWSAVASSIVGSTVATMALASSEDGGREPR